jgi:hypothetical protein
MASSAPPSVFTPVGNAEQDHTLGALDAQFDPANADTYPYWIQTGWYTGTITNEEIRCHPGTCVDRFSTYGRYVEDNNTAGYSVFDYGQAMLYSTSTLQIVQSGGCWYTSDAKRRPLSSGTSPRNSE